MDSGTNSGHLGEGVFYDDTVSLSWETLAAPLAGSELLRLNESNERLLHFVEVMEGHHDSDEEHSGKEPHQELARIEFKLNLLLEMVGAIHERHVSAPDPVPVRITASMLQWEQPGTAPAQGDQVLVRLYINRQSIRPLLLTGTITESRKVNGHRVVRLEHHGLVPVVHALLEKMIFRHHRRMVAMNRQLGGTDS